ncbi:MAG: hypothetical protein LBS34_00940 [Rickettsiales bacterium]|nr:hypothetical protein [Rickettsiales bacterium]
MKRRILFFILPLLLVSTKANALLTEEKVKEGYDIVNSSVSTACNNKEKEIGYMKEEYRIYSKYFLQPLEKDEKILDNFFYAKSFDELFGSFDNFEKNIKNECKKTAAKFLLYRITTADFRPLYNYAANRRENVAFSRVFSVYRDCMAKALIDTLEDVTRKITDKKDIPYRQFERFFKLSDKMSDVCAAQALVYNNHYF